MDDIVFHCHITVQTVDRSIDKPTVCEGFALREFYYYYLHSGVATGQGGPDTVAGPFLRSHMHNVPLSSF